MTPDGDALLPFPYLSSKSLNLRQGEVLEGLIEFRPIMSSGQKLEAKQVVDLLPIDHKYAIIVSQDCDLEGDYKARYTKEVPEDKLLAHVLFCDLFAENEIRARSKLGSDLFKRVRQNQDERYHRLDRAPIGDTGQFLPDLYADFKLTFSLPVDLVYWLTSSSQANRKGYLPSPHLEDFMHRLYSFLGRVAVPKLEENKKSTIAPRDSSLSKGLTSP